jgi:predicted Zn-dependent protease
MAIGQGRFAEAQRLQAAVVAEQRRQGLGDLANHLNQAEGLNLFEAGAEEAGRRLFQSAPIDPENGDELIGVAEMGDAKTALSILQTMRQKYPQGTLWNQYFGPRIEAVVAMANHKPEEAVRLMEATRALDQHGLDHPRFRGDAYLAAGQPALAEKEYRAVTAHHEIDPLLGDYPLAWLGLGRALAAEGKKAEAEDAYRHFLALWAHADADAQYLVAAKRELAELLKTASPEKVQAAHGF